MMGEKKKRETMLNNSKPKCQKGERFVNLNHTKIYFMLSLNLGVFNAGGQTHSLTSAG